MNREVVTVAFSGGKDSAAAALRLREGGRQVRALTMRLGLPGEEERLGRIAGLARAIGVPWRAVDLEEAFRRKVVDRFVDAYRRGLTPNPCVLCNRDVKFALLMEQALRFAPGGPFATGHYADKVRLGNRWFLREPAERGKSQVYFLATIGPIALEKTEFPLAGLSVEEVREMVSALPLATRSESQDVCFLQGEPLAAFLHRHIPGGFAAGDLVNTAGERIGRHEGALHFTIGQRRGTGHAAGRRLYVVGCDPAANTVTLGDEKELFSDRLLARDPVFWRPLHAGEKFAVKVRYEPSGHEAEITEVAAGHIRARFKDPVRAVTPGQLAVFHDGDVVVAAGEIDADEGES
ncbi:MAG: tRNA-specific 2-thiouridylase [Candidatus Aminicenantes bacterium]|nr:tRNA-specific 2-thiouridylase [Candidatus Aminicenantes bacterium]